MKGLKLGDSYKRCIELRRIRRNKKWMMIKEKIESTRFQIKKFDEFLYGEAIMDGKTIMGEVSKAIMGEETIATKASREITSGFGEVECYRKCGNCDYCDKKGRYHICRRLPPMGDGWCCTRQNLSPEQCYFPRVELDDWCGDFRVEFRKDQIN